MCNLYHLNANPGAKSFRDLFQLSSDELAEPLKSAVWPLYKGVSILARSYSGARREAAVAQCELAPHWAPDMKIGRGNNNARAESLTEKPTFRTAFKSRRCLIPATGYCEPHDKKMWEFK